MDRYGIETIAESVYQSSVCPFMRERECANGNEDCQKCVKEWFEDHDKQIRDETTEEFKKLIYEMAYDTDVQFFSNDIMISIWGSSIDKITEQMKREQNE